LSFSSCDDLFGISLNINGLYTFKDAQAGYPDQTPLSVTVTNNSSRSTRCHVTVSSTSSFGLAEVGDGYGFLLGGSEDNYSDRRHAFVVYPKRFLTPGTYIATVTVSSDLSIGSTASFDVKFTVLP